ncbi:MAG: hypothetical protein WDN10_00515 [bacterium]
MGKLHARIAIGAFIIVSIAVFAFFIAHTEDGAVPEKATESGAPAASLVSVKKTASKGVLTITGSVRTPTPCYTLDAKAQTASTTPPSIRVDLTVPPDDGICLQKSADQPFSLKISGAATAPLFVYLNGETATTTP